MATKIRYAITVNVFSQIMVGEALCSRLVWSS